MNTHSNLFLHSNIDRRQYIQVWVLYTVQIMYLHHSGRSFGDHMYAFLYCWEVGYV
jgi:hypothetical protein